MDPEKGTRSPFQAQNSVSPGTEKSGRTYVLSEVFRTPVHAVQGEQKIVMEKN